MKSRTVGFFFPHTLDHAVADALQARHFRQFLRGERLVHALPREIEVERLRQQRQRIDLERQLFDLGPFVFGLGFGRSRDGVDEVRDLDAIRIAAEARHLRLEVRIVALADIDVRIDRRKMISPQRAPNDLPRPLDPAWMMTG